LPNRSIAWRPPVVHSPGARSETGDRSGKIQHRARESPIIVIEGDPMLTVHHLGKSQSERIVWLCEELGIPYELKCYARAPLLAPPEYKALHPIGAAPVITDGDIVLAESGAIVEY